MIEYANRDPVVPCAALVRGFMEWTGLDPERASVLIGARPRVLGNAYKREIYLSPRRAERLVALCRLVGMT